MTLLEYRDKIIAEGLQSVELHETDIDRREGGIQGFQLCRLLFTPDDFTRILSERMHHENVLRSNLVEHREYWCYRMATLQIEFLYERMKVAWHYNHIQTFDSLSANAMLYYARAMSQS